MSTSSVLADPDRRLVETTGIEVIAESERTARPRDLFWPWFAARPETEKAVTMATGKRNKARMNIGFTLPASR